MSLHEDFSPIAGSWRHPPACSFRIAMICSSVCLLRFIDWSFPRARLQFTLDQFKGATSLFPLLRTRICSGQSGFYRRDPRLTCQRREVDTIRRHLRPSYPIHGQGWINFDVMPHSIIRLNIEHYEGFSRLTEGLVLDRVSGVDDGSPLVIEGSSWGAGIKFFCVSTVGIVCADRSLLLGRQKSGLAVGSGRQTILTVLTGRRGSSRALHSC